MVKHQTEKYLNQVLKYLFGWAKICEYNTDEFGPDLRQNKTFSFVRQSLRDLSLVLEIGDVVEWFTIYWEITNINENQLVGGQYKQLDGQHIHSVICGVTC